MSGRLNGLKCSNFGEMLGRKGSEKKRSENKPKHVATKKNRRIDLIDNRPSTNKLHHFV